MYRKWMASEQAGGDTPCANDYFNKFDKEKKGYLNKNDFEAMTSKLFDGKDDDVEDSWIDDLFLICDIDQDGKISKSEFERSYNSWIHSVLKPVTALIVVDVQNDFISGTLALRSCPAAQDGNDVIPVINGLLCDVTFDAVVYTLDWHPADHISFFENVNERPFHSSSKIKQKDAKLFDEVTFDVKPRPMEQVLWPAHCIQGSHGAELHKDLTVLDDHVTIKKGCSSDVDSYSAFWDNGKLGQTSLHDQLKKRNVTDVYVCGLAYDVCVAYTATHAREYGYRTVFVEDACRGVSHEGMQKFKRDLQETDVLFVQSNQVKDLVNALHRPRTLAKVSIDHFKQSLKAK